MSVTRLPAWNVTAIEIALDLQSDGFAGADPGRFAADNPRISLVVGFALTPQLKRVIAAVGRAIPARLPREIRVVPTKTRGGPTATGTAFSIQPLIALIRLQLRFCRAIEPGLAEEAGSIEGPEQMDEHTERFVRDFIRFKMPPTFEPSSALADFTFAPLRVSGVTIYRLGSRAEPQAILGHWAYVKSARSSVHLPGGP
jgi:hypothetical protein